MVHIIDRKVTVMDKIVYKIDVATPLKFFKCGFFVGDPGWIHKSKINNADYELMIVTKGTIYIQIEHKRYSIHKNECIFVPAKSFHFGYQPTNCHTEHYWMHFFAPNQITKSTTSDKLNSEILLPIHFKLADINSLLPLIKQLLNSAHEKNSESIHYTQLNYLLSNIIVEISLQYERCLKLKTATDQETDSANQRIEQIANWINLRAADHITASDVATHFEISREYLTRLFNKQYGMTTSHYIHSVKIKIAQTLLLTSDKTVKQIAFELSFENEKYFMRLFKQNLSMTPTDYRNLYSKEYVNGNITDIVDFDLLMPSSRFTSV
jgi:AraC-like DNA-binding protein